MNLTLMFVLKRVDFTFKSLESLYCYDSYFQSNKINSEIKNELFKFKDIICKSQRGICSK